LKYIHLDNYQQRSLCMLCAYIHQEIDMKEMVDDATEEGRVFPKKMLRKSKSMQNYSFKWPHS